MTHDLVVVGSGFGGLFTAKALAREDLRITVLARTSHHLFQPLLYQVATGILSPGEVAPATREILNRQRNVRVVLADVTDIDLARRVVTARTLDEEHEYAYDSLVVAAGSGQSWFGNDEFAVFAPGMKSVDDALELRGRILGSYELAEVAAASGEWEEVERLLTFVVVGAGPTGVEMAGQLVELAQRALPGEFRHIDTRQSRIVLVDALDRVLPGFHENLSAKTLAELRKMGVEVHLGARVVGVDQQGVDLEDADGQRTRIDATTKVWAAGVAASPLARRLAEQTGVEVDRSGRYPVQPDLTVHDHPEVFVIGDMAALDLPGVAQVAIQGAKHAADQIKRRLRGEDTGQKFTYFDKGNMATISRFRAIAEVGPVRVTGVPAWGLWLGVHLAYLVGFKNRASTLFRWGVSFVGRGRSERTVTEQQVFGRLAMAERASGNTPPPSDDEPGRP